MSYNLIEEVREMGEHPSRADLPMGKTLRDTAEYMEALEGQIQSWTEEARRYAENADFWRAKCEALQADKAKLREAGYDALVALGSARAFILKKYGSKNPAREDAIAALFAALQETER